MTSSATSANTALLALRVGIGVMFVLHGANKVLGSGGLAGTARWFEALGMRPGWLDARFAAATEIGAGTLFVAGLLVPLDCAAMIGLMAVAAGLITAGRASLSSRGVGST